jgi:hypothetical protein
MVSSPRYEAVGGGFDEKRSCTNPPSLRTKAASKVAKRSSRDKPLQRDLVLSPGGRIFIRKFETTRQDSLWLKAALSYGISGALGLALSTISAAVSLISESKIYQTDAALSTDLEKVRLLTSCTNQARTYFLMSVTFRISKA